MDLPLNFLWPNCHIMTRYTTGNLNFYFVVLASENRIHSASTDKEKSDLRTEILQLHEELHQQFPGLFLNCFICLAILYTVEP